MTRTYVQSGQAKTTGPQTTLAATLAGVATGNLVKLGLAVYQDSAVVSLSDGLNNWTLTQSTAYASFVLQTWDCYIATGGTLSLTVTIGGSKYCSIAWAEYHLSASSAWTIGGAGSGTGDTASPVLVIPPSGGGSLTPTNSDLAFLVIQANGESISSTGGGFTLRQAVAFSTGTNISIAIADALNTGTATLTPTCVIAGSNYWTEQLSAITGQTNPQPLVDLVPCISKNGLLFLETQNQTGTAPLNITAVSADPTVWVNGTPATLGSRVWTDVSQQCPSVAYRITSPSTIASTDVVTLTLPAAGIVTTAGASTAIATAITVPNYFGQLEPSIGGFTPFDVTGLQTLPLGVDFGYPGVNGYFGVSHLKNWAKRFGSWVAGTGTTSVTQSGADPSIPTWTAGGVISSSFCNTGGEPNDIDANGMPSPVGVWTIIFDDPNASSASLRTQCQLVGNANTCVGADTGVFSNSTTTGATSTKATLVSVVGTTVTIQYTLTYTSNPNLAHGYGLGLQLFFKNSTGTWNISNLAIFDPHETDLGRSDPYAMSKFVTESLTAPNGNGPALLRFMEMVLNYTATSSVIEFADLPDPTGMSWGLLPFQFVQMSSVRVYNTNTTLDNFLGNSTYPYAASTKRYDHLLGNLSAASGGTDSTGPYIDYTLSAVALLDAQSDMGQSIVPYPIGAVNGYVVLEITTVAPHGMRTRDIFQFPGIISLGQPVVIPCTGGGTPTAISGTVTVTFGSTTITFSGSVTLPANAVLTFSSDSTGQAYITNNGSPSTGTTFTLISPYNGTTSSSAMATMTAGTNINNVVGNVYVTGASTFCMIFGNSYGITSGTGVQQPVSTGNAPISLIGNPPGTVTVTTGSATVTFSTAQTLSGGTSIVFSSQSGTTYTLAANVTTATTATLESPYSGTFSSTATMQTFMQGFRQQRGATITYGCAVHWCTQWPNACIPWLPMPVGAVDSFYTSVADDIAANATPGMQIIVEMGLEPWNTPGFKAGLLTSVYGNTLKFIPALEMINSCSAKGSAYLSPTGAKTLTSYQAYTMLANHAHDVLQAQLDTHGTGIQIIRMFGSQYVGAGYTSQIISYVNIPLGSPSTGGLQAQIPVGGICIAPYNGTPITNETGDLTFNAAFATGGGNWPAPLLIDYYRHYAKYGLLQYQCYQQHRSAISLYAGPTGYAGQVAGLPSLYGYEGDIARITGNFNLDTDLMFRPQIYDALTTWIQSVQDGSPGHPGSGINGQCYFNYGGNVGNIMWPIMMWHGQGIGPGTSNAFTTNQGAYPASGNGICNYLGNQSVFADAIQTWFGAANGTPTTSFSVSPSSIPVNESSPITLTLTGTNTAWTSGSTVTITNSVSGTTTVTAGTWTAISTISATLTVTTRAGAGTYEITIDGIVSPVLTAATSLFTVSPTTIIQNESSPITLTLTGTNTAWTSGSTVKITNSVSGTTTVTAGTWTAISTISATLTVTTGVGAGTWTLTIDSVVSPALTVATALFTVSPTAIAQNESSPVTLTLTGTNTTWTSGSVVSITNSVSGTTTVTAGTWTRISGTSATLTVTTGAGAGTYEITIDGIVSLTLTVSTALFTVSPTAIAQNESSPITLTLTGTNTTWTSGSVVTITNSVSGTTTVTAGTWTRISGTSATLTVTTGAGGGTWTLTIDSIVSPAMTVTAAVASITPRPSRIPPNISSPSITLNLIGIGTSWTSGSAVSIQNSVTGTTYVTAGTWTAISSTQATLTVTTGPGSPPNTGTFTITVDSVVSPTLTVATRKAGWFRGLSRRPRLSR